MYSLNLLYPFTYFGIRKFNHHLSVVKRIVASAIIGYAYKVITYKNENMKSTAL